MSHECGTCAECKARDAANARVDEVADRVGRAFDALQHRMTVGISEDNAKVAARGHALSLAWDIVRECSGPRY